MRPAQTNMYMPTQPLLTAILDYCVLNDAVFLANAVCGLGICVGLALVLAGKGAEVKQGEAPPSPSPGWAGWGRGRASGGPAYTAVGAGHGDTRGGGEGSDDDGQEGTRLLAVLAVPVDCNAGSVATRTKPPAL